MNAYQVLLPKWLEKHVKHRADELDLSYSEVLRVQVCVAIISFHTVQFPEYKTSMTVEHISQIVKKVADKKIEKKEFQEFASDLYYETRKALEYRYSEDRDA